MSNPVFRRAVLTRSIVSLLSLSVLVPAAFGADGIFVNESGGGWATSSNWMSGTIADGAGFSADFNTLNITADRTVTLGAARTIGHLVFGDTTTTAGSAGSCVGRLPPGAGSYSSRKGEGFLAPPSR